MKMKRIYNSPNVEIVGLKIENICQVIHQGSDNDDWAKEQKVDVVEEEESLPIDKNIWEDDEE